MTDQERTALEWRLATRLGDDAWEFNQYGGFHEPKPLARSLDVLVPLVEAWCDTHRKTFAIERWPHVWNESEGKFVPHYGANVGGRIAKGNTRAETLALALDAAMA